MTKVQQSQALANVALRGRRRSKARLHLLLAVAMMAASACAPNLALAQGLPPHPPGSICLTPYFWCWMNGQYPIGSPCGCPSPQGMIGGRAV